MELATESDVYGPGVSNEGVYVDQIPVFNHLSQGLRCPCTNNCYSTRQSFCTHTKTQGHKRWLDALNANRTNHFAELEQSRQLIRQQQLIIAQLERDKHNMMTMVNILSRQLTESVSSRTGDLLDFIN